MSNGPEIPAQSSPALNSQTILAVSAALAADRSKLGPDEQLLLDLADGQGPVSDLLRIAGLPGTVTMRLLHSLFDRGFLQAVAAPVPREESPRPLPISSFVAASAADKFSRPGLARELTDFISKIAEKRSSEMPLAGEDPFARGAAAGTPAPARQPEPREGRRGGNGKSGLPRYTGGKGRPAPVRPGVKSTAGEFVAALPPPDPTLDRPTRAGAYEIVTRMAQGNVGSVYLCRRAGAQQFQHLYALKVIRRHADEAEDAAQSFVRQARVGMLVAHPNVLPVIDFGQYQKQPFLLMEYVEGTHLGELLMDGVPCPPQLIVPVIIDVLRGLQRAHDAKDERGQPLGLVHGDLSPQSILVGTDGAARLTDFGQCRFTAFADAPNRAVTSKVAPAYLAPEQIKGEATDARTDLFSLGVVLWTGLTGRSLFADDSHEQTVANVLRKPVLPPSQYGKSRGFDEICRKALNRNRTVRFQSAEEMAVALTRVAAAEGILPGDRAVSTWVQQAMNEVLLERRLHLKDVATGKTVPAVVVAEGALPAE